MRFGDPFETGYRFTKSYADFLTLRFSNFGLFDAAYLPFNLWHFFLAGPHADFKGEMKLVFGDLDQFGAALPMVSPFVLLSLRARLDLDALSAWAAILVVLAPTLLYYNNGFAQVGDHVSYSIFFRSSSCSLRAAWHETE